MCTSTHPRLLAFIVPVIFTSVHACIEAYISFRVPLLTGNFASAPLDIRESMHSFTVKYMYLWTDASAFPCIYNPINICMSANKHSYVRDVVIFLLHDTCIFSIRPGFFIILIPVYFPYVNPHILKSVNPCIRTCIHASETPWTYSYSRIYMHAYFHPAYKCSWIRDSKKIKPMVPFIRAFVHPCIRESMFLITFTRELMGFFYFNFLYIYASTYRCSYGSVHPRLYDIPGYMYSCLSNSMHSWFHSSSYECIYACRHPWLPESVDLFLQYSAEVCIIAPVLSLRSCSRICVNSCIR